MDNVFAVFVFVNIFSFVVFESHANMFYSYLNTRHENIKFICEKEANSKLPLLDILINNSDPDLQTSVFQKKKDIYWATVELFEFGV